MNNVEGFTFLVEQGLMAEAAPIKVDFHPHTGFNVLSSIQPSASSGCSSCTSCG